MFGSISDFFAVVFGYIMHFLYIALDFIHLPYLWLCIILFAAITRLISVPGFISSNRKALLSPVIDFEISEVRERFGSIKKTDKKRVKEYKKETRAIYRKYGVSSGSGCLFAILQLPIFIGLFQVVNNPFEYVPALSGLSVTSRANVNDFFGLSLEASPSSMGSLGFIFLIAVLISMNLNNFIDLFKFLCSKNKKIKLGRVIPQLISIALMGWMSYKLPIALSLYWSAGYVAVFFIKRMISSSLKNNLQIQRIIGDYELIKREKQEKESLTV